MWMYVGYGSEDGGWGCGRSSQSPDVTLTFSYRACKVSRSTTVLSMFRIAGEMKQKDRI